MCYLDEVRIGILFDDGEISVYDLEFDGYILDYSKQMVIQKLERAKKNAIKNVQVDNYDLIMSLPNRLTVCNVEY